MPHMDHVKEQREGKRLETENEQHEPEQSRMRDHLEQHADAKPMKKQNGVERESDSGKQSRRCYSTIVGQPTREPFSSLGIEVVKHLSESGKLHRAVTKRG